MDIVNTQVKNQLGEGPCWHSFRNSWLWVDILTHTVFELPFESVQSKPVTFDVPDYPSAVFPVDQACALVLTRSGLIMLNLDNAKMSKFTDFHIDNTKRTNDATIAPGGKLWFGVMELVPSGWNGAVYSYSKGQGVTERLNNIGIPNLFVQGINQSLFIADSYDSQIYQLNDDSENTDVEVKVVNFESCAGVPDGGAMDDSHRIWNARWGAGKIVAFNSITGRKVDEFDTPFLQPSSCCFGGPGLSYLFITSAIEGMSEEQLGQYPSSGGFMIKELSDVKGLPTHDVVESILC